MPKYCPRPRRHRHQLHLAPAVTGTEVHVHAPPRCHRRHGCIGRHGRHRCHGRHRWHRRDLAEGETVYLVYATGSHRSRGALAVAGIGHLQAVAGLGVAHELRELVAGAIVTGGFEDRAVDAGDHVTFTQAGLVRRAAGVHTGDLHTSTLAVCPFVVIEIHPKEPAVLELHHPGLGLRDPVHGVAVQLQGELRHPARILRQLLPCFLQLLLELLLTLYVAARGGRGRRRRGGCRCRVGSARCQRRCRETAQQHQSEFKALHDIHLTAVFIRYRRPPPGRNAQRPGIAAGPPAASRVVRRAGPRCSDPPRC